MFVELAFQLLCKAQLKTKAPRHPWRKHIEKLPMGGKHLSGPRSFLAASALLVSRSAEPGRLQLPPARPTPPIAAL